MRHANGNVSLTSKKFNMNQKWNNCWCECKNLKEHCVCKKDYFWNPAICNCKDGKYLRSISDSVVVWNEIIEETKTISK